MELTVTAEMLAAVDLARPCDESRRRYEVGTPLSALTGPDAAWCEEYLPDVVAEIEREAGIPLWALAGSGDGYGYGDGYGSGYGAQ